VTATVPRRMVLMWVGHRDHFLAHLDLKRYAENGSWSSFCGVEFYNSPGTAKAAQGRHWCGACLDVVKQQNEQGASYVVE
jgi:hypothetical protein